MQMTSILTIGAMAIAGGVMAQDTVPATPVQPAQPVTPAAEVTPAQPAEADKPQATREEADALMKNMVALLTEVNAAVSSVTDKASADAAAAKLTEIKAKMEALQKSTENMAPPSPADMSALQQQYLPEIMKISSEMQKTVQTLKENKFYGSEALETALSAGMM